VYSSSGPLLREGFVEGLLQAVASLLFALQHIVGVPLPLRERLAQLLDVPIVRLIALAQELTQALHLFLQTLPLGGPAVQDDCVRTALRPFVLFIPGLPQK
jgi:hypothetical protein